MNDTLRASLWNLMRGFIPDDAGYGGRVVDVLTQAVLRVPIEDVDHQAPRWWLGQQVQAMRWHQVYDLLEEFAERITDFSRRSLVTPEQFRAFANRVLADENAGYRFVAGRLTEVTSPTEIAEIETALAKAERHALRGVEVHLQQALSLLGQRPEPDYRNSIKEAISAVESAAKLIAGEKKGTLDDALDRLPLHGAFKSALIKLYGFTSDSSGIRHGLLEAATVEGADARFFVVACAAFVSWLITKADAAGLLKAGS